MELSNYNNLMGVLNVQRCNISVWFVCNNFIYDNYI